MIKLEILNIETVSEWFYDNIGSEIKYRICFHKDFLKNYKTDLKQQDLFDYLCNNIEEIIKSELEFLVDNVVPELSNLFKENYAQNSLFKETMDKIFFYEEYDRWKAYELSKRLGVNTCPYCNRSYITALGSDNEKFVRCDYDHFLNKKDYPYFRLSFFNLIPSCFICNQRAKKDQPTNLNDFIYPYKERYGNEANFSFLPKSYLQIIGYSNPMIYIQIKDKLSAIGKKIDNNQKLFRINQQYLTNAKELEYLIKIRRKAGSGYINNIMNSYPGLFKSKKDVFEFVFRSIYDDTKQIDQPLSKFTKDICMEIGLFNV